MIAIEQVTKMFGGLKAVNQVSFNVKKGSIVGVIGPNGSGKTTLFNVISGYYKPTEGRVFLEDEEISGQSADSISKKGLSRTFQIVKPFKNITVFENILVGAFLRHPNRHEAYAKVNEIIDFLDLGKFINVCPINIPLALKKKVEIGRALATSPKILLLDEVMGGLTPNETDQLLETILMVNKMGMTIMIIEHKMKAIMSIAERVVVLDGGAKIAEGTPEEVCRDATVIKAYLGDKYNAEHS